MTGIAWSQGHGYRALVVETTPQQIGAVALFRHVGFREAGRSMVGRFELTWFDLPLHLQVRERFLPPGGGAPGPG